MDPTVALVVLGFAALVVVLATLVVARTRRARAARRVAALVEVADRIDAAVSSLGGLTPVGGLEAPAVPAEVTAPAPPVEGTLPGRAGLLWAIATGIADARSRGLRLAAAVVRSGDGDTSSLAAHARSVADVPVYAVGPSAVALVLPGLGRADALGLLARIEAECPSSSGKAVELGPDEDAVALATRLLGAGADA